MLVRLNASVSCWSASAISTLECLESRVQYLINLEPSSADGCGHGCGARFLVIDCSSSAGAEMRGLRMLQHQIHARYVDHGRFGSDILPGARMCTSISAGIVQIGVYSLV